MHPTSHNFRLIGRSPALTALFWGKADSENAKAIHPQLGGIVDQVAAKYAVTAAG